MAIILDVYGLSARERQITQDVLLGRSTNEIADRRTSLPTPSKIT